MDERWLDLRRFELAQRVGDRFKRSVDVGLDDQVEVCCLTALDLLEDVFKTSATTGRRGVSAKAGLAVVVLTSVGDLGGHLLARGDVELIARFGDLGEAEHLNWRRWASLFDVLALVVDERTNAAPCSAGDHRVADLERAFLHENGCDRTTTDVEVRLEHNALGSGIGVSTKLFDLGDQQDLIEQVIDTNVLQCRDLLGDDVATEGLCNQVMLGELCEHPCWVRIFTVDLVDRNDDRHFSGLGVTQRFNRLWHYAVVGRYHQDDNVGRVRATRAHCGEGLVTRGIDKGKGVILADRLIRTDVLGDAAGLAVNDVGVADLVEQLGLTVIDVAHDGDNRWTQWQIASRSRFFGDLFFDAEHLAELFFVLLARIDELDLRAEILSELGDQVIGERLRRRNHLALLHHELHDVGDRTVEFRSEVERRDRTFDNDLTLRYRGVLRAVARDVHWLKFFAVATTTTLALWRTTATWATWTAATWTTSTTATGRATCAGNWTRSAATWAWASATTARRAVAATAIATRAAGTAAATGRTTWSTRGWWDRLAGC